MKRPWIIYSVPHPNRVISDPIKMILNDDENHFLKSASAV